MKKSILKLLFAITMSAVVSGCGEETKVENEVPPIAEKPVPSDVQAGAQNEGLYDLKSSINSAIGDSIEEDIRDAVENQVEKNNKE